MIGAWLRRCRGLGDEVLGINARNLEYVYPWNKRVNFREVDDKLITKALLARRGVPVPGTLAVFERFGDLDCLPAAMDLATDGCVVKPSRSSGGTGILVVRRAEGGGWTTPGRRVERRLSPEDVAEHIIEILSGLYGPARLDEKAFLEELLTPEETLGALSYRGLPDVRIIVFRGRPAMAMLRLATRRSAGKANLHQGAVGVGVDSTSGETVHAMVANRSIDRHPDSGASLLGIRVPFWTDLVGLAESAAACVRLGYVGVDLCVDKARGPMVIEINARPGLAIQLANHAGLIARLEAHP